VLNRSTGRTAGSSGDRNPFTRPRSTDSTDSTVQRFNGSTVVLWLAFGATPTGQRVALQADMLPFPWESKGCAESCGLERRPRGRPREMVPRDSLEGPRPTPRLCCEPYFELGPRAYHIKTVSFLGPWAPRTRIRSISPVRLGPVTREIMEGQWVPWSCSIRWKASVRSPSN